MALPFFFIPINTVAYSDLPRALNHASALINLMRNLGGSTGIAIAVLLLERRTEFHHARMVEHLTPYDRVSSAPLHTITNMFSSGAGGVGGLISPATRRAGDARCNRPGPSDDARLPRRLPHHGRRLLTGDRPLPAPQEDEESSCVNGTLMLLIGTRNVTSRGNET